MKLVLFQTAGAEIAPGVLTDRGVVSVAGAVPSRHTPQATMEAIIDEFDTLRPDLQRLANGSTLICEGCDGRIFEVTADGQVVWEFVNPHVSHEAGRPGLNNWVFRAFRYTPEEIERARRA